MYMDKMSKDIPHERKIVESIRRELKTLEIWHVKIHGGAFQSLGLPDIICIVGGRFVGMEVKRPVVGKLTEIQRAVLGKINAAGGYGCVVRSVEEAKIAIRNANEGYEAEWKAWR